MIVNFMIKLPSYEFSLWNSKSAASIFTSSIFFKAVDNCVRLLINWIILVEKVSKLGMFQISCKAAMCWWRSVEYSFRMELSYSQFVLSAFDLASIYVLWSDFCNTKTLLSCFQFLMIRHGFKLKTANTFLTLSVSTIMIVYNIKITFLVSILELLVDYESLLRH